MSVPTHRLEVTRIIRASPDRVFAAWTDPAAIVQWWQERRLAIMTDRST